ncbi:MAG TPA: LLM class flavin-dependent oxidoreductase [Burkholderiales bacterium]|nr:LLM class flavin-dependent oxidoreductase [Burkholderiales bacterium]
MEFGTSMPMWLLAKLASEDRYKDIERFLQAMEDFGFSIFQQGDHVADPGLSHHESEDRSRLVYSDVFSTLASLAPLHPRMRFLAGVVILPLRHPLLVAHATATLDLLSRGRFILGTGSGYARAEFNALGIDMKERFGRTEESLQVIGSLLQDSSTTFEGRYYKMHDAAITCRPYTKPRPPIWVGGVGEKAALRAARLGDAWFPSISGYARASGPTPRRIAEMSKVARAARSESGKPPLPVFASSAIALTFMTDPKPLDAAPDPRDRLVNGTGGPADLVELLIAYREAGLSGFVFSCHTETSLDGCLRAIDTFANKIMPKVMPRAA